MSASQHKKKRQSQTAEAARPAAQPKSSRTPWILGGIGVILLVVLAIYFGITSSGILARHTTAATAGSHSLSAVEYNYFYQNLYYSSYAYMLTDASIPLSEQFYDEAAGTTWADYLRQETNAAIAEAYALYDAAMADGFTLSDADRASVEANLASAAQQAASQGLSLSGYLTGVYGSGANEKTYRANLELLQTASAYQTAHADGLTYDDAQIEDYYRAHQDTIDVATYRSYTCTVYGDDGETVDAAASEAQARGIADGARGGDEDRFLELAGVDAANDTTLSYCAAYSGIPDNLRDWITDPARQYGDTEVLPADDGSAVAVMFLANAAQSDVNAVNVRHILITADSGVTAQAVLDEYLAGPRTEEAFAELARTYSADGNAAAGGLYEDIYPGYMVRSFNDWCFDPARAAGDTGIVESTYGSHVMYFAGQGSDSARNIRTRQAMRSEDTVAWADALAAAVTVENRAAGMRLTALG